jgi:hypothetical protein
VAKEFKLDIFELLDQLNRRDLTIWSKLTEEQRKAFAPLVVERWMAGTSDKRQVVMINELVNPFVFELADHPELLMKLLSVANSGGRQRYQWMPMKAGKKTKLEHSVRAITEALSCTKSEAQEYTQLLDAEDIMTYAERMGWQKEELAKLKAELKK